jgi:hypothetical protein
MRNEEEWRKTLHSAQRDVPLSHLQYHCFDDAGYWRIWLKTNNPFADTRDIKMWLEDDRVVRIETYAYFHIDL